MPPLIPILQRLRPIGLLRCRGHPSLSRGQKAIVFSRGTLFLDGCDFSRCSAGSLVYSEGETPVIRNAILGDVNCESVSVSGPGLLSVVCFCFVAIPPGVSVWRTVCW